MGTYNGFFKKILEKFNIGAFILRNNNYSVRRADCAPFGNIF